MRFVCDSCRAQYMISDDKIGAKGVKIRCKKCGHTIVVRPAGAAAPKDEGSSEASASESTATTAANGSANSNASMLASLGTPPEGGLFTGVEEDEIGAVFDQVLNSGSQKIGSGDSSGDKAKAASTEAVRKLAEAEDEPDEPKAAAAANDWFVAIEDKQVGPLTVEKIKEHWDRGEVGPDSLCWRAGFSDWIPLSEAKEMASVLAPRPAKPVIVAPAAVSAAASAPSAPVESAFSAGGSSKNNRPEIPAAPALGQEPTSSGWKPSAASVLASLVKEENDALSKPPPKPAVEEKPSAPGLLDLPPEPAMAPAARAAPMMAVAAEPMRAPQPAPMPYQPAPAPAPSYAQPAPAYGQPAYAGAGYPQPAYQGYPPPAAPAQQGGGNKTVMFAAIGGVVVLLLAVGGFFAFRSPPPQPSEPIAAVTPAPQPKAPEPTPPVAKVEPTPAPAVAATPAPAVAATPTPAPAAGTATPPAVAAATPTPPPTTPAPPPAAAEAVAKVTPGTREPSSKTGERKPSSESSRPSSSSSSKSEPVAKPSKQSDDGLGDDFDDLFGTKKPSGAKTSSGEKTPSTYIPPAPGSGASDVPEKLGQSDIMAVVVANKPAIVKCVNEQKKKDPGLTGRLVMRWVIQTNGKTTGVSVKSEEFKKTYMATCISGLIKGWNFPKHRKQGDPIDFPFIF